MFVFVFFDFMERFCSVLPSSVTCDFQVVLSKSLTTSSRSFVLSSCVDEAMKMLST